MDFVNIFSLKSVNDTPLSIPYSNHVVQNPPKYFFMYLKRTIEIISDGKCLTSVIVDSTHIPPNKAKENIKIGFSGRVEDISTVKTVILQN